MSTMCELCGDAEADLPDVSCIPCRIEVTAMSYRVTDPVEITLSSHQRLHLTDTVMCICAETFDGPAYYRRHVATLIYEALGLKGPAPWKPASEELPS